MILINYVCPYEIFEAFSVHKGKRKTYILKQTFVTDPPLQPEHVSFSTYMCSMIKSYQALNMAMQMPNKRPS